MEPALWTSPTSARSVPQTKAPPTKIIVNMMRSNVFSALREELGEGGEGERGAHVKGGNLRERE